VGDGTRVPDGTKSFLQWGCSEHLHLPHVTELLKTQKVIKKNMACARVGKEHHFNLQNMKCLPTYGG